MMTRIPSEFSTSWPVFVREMERLLEEGTAKGYSTAVREVAGIGYCEGEVIHKLARWRKKRNPTDLAKAAAHLYLVFHDTQGERK